MSSTHRSPTSRAGATSARTTRGSAAACCAAAPTRCAAATWPGALRRAIRRSLLADPLAVEAPRIPTVVVGVPAAATLTGWDRLRRRRPVARVRVPGPAAVVVAATIGTTTFTTAP